MDRAPPRIIECDHAANLRELICIKEIDKSMIKTVVPINIRKVYIDALFEQSWKRHFTRHMHMCVQIAEFGSPNHGQHRAPGGIKAVVRVN